MKLKISKFLLLTCFLQALQSHALNSLNNDLDFQIDQAVQTAVPQTISLKDCTVENKELRQQLQYERQVKSDLKKTVNELKSKLKEAVKEGVKQEIHKKYKVFGDLVEQQQKELDLSEAVIQEQNEKIKKLKNLLEICDQSFKDQKSSDDESCDWEDDNSYSESDEDWNLENKQSNKKQKHVGYISKKNKSMSKDQSEDYYFDNNQKNQNNKKMNIKFQFLPLPNFEKKDLKFKNKEDWENKDEWSVDFKDEESFCSDDQSLEMNNYNNKNVKHRRNSKQNMNDKKQKKQQKSESSYDEEIEDSCSQSKLSAEDESKHNKSKKSQKISQSSENYQEYYNQKDSNKKDNYKNFVAFKNKNGKTARNNSQKQDFNFVENWNGFTPNVQIDKFKDNSEQKVNFGSVQKENKDENKLLKLTSSVKSDY